MSFQIKYKDCDRHGVTKPVKITISNFRCTGNSYTQIERANNEIWFIPTTNVVWIKPMDTEKEEKIPS